MKIKTQIFKEVLTIANKGAGKNKLYPMTNYVCIEVKDNKLKVSTTNGTDALYITEKLADKTPDFFVLTEIETLNKLVQKTTVEYITLEIKDKDSILHVRGNGNYKLNIPQDENGCITGDTTIKIPEKHEEYVISAELLHNAHDNTKNTIAKTLDNIYLTGFYFDAGGCITTDCFIASVTDEEVFNTPTLLAPSTMELLTLAGKTKTIKCTEFENIIIFEFDNITIKSRQLDVNDYPVEAIGELLSTEQHNNLTLKKDILLDTLDRISLFTSKFGQKTITLTLAGGELTISNEDDSSFEAIVNEEYKKLKSAILKLELLTFQTIVKDINVDEIEIGYGSGNCILVYDKNCTKIISLLEE
jgi:DNA polymerase III sliding clamp (beta) subunit (PCNA family)